MTAPLMVLDSENLDNTNKWQGLKKKKLEYGTINKRSHIGLLL